MTGGATGHPLSSPRYAQRRIDAFLNEADAAAERRDWVAVTESARAVLAIDADNEDAAAFLSMAEANRGAASATPADAAAPPPTPAAPTPPSTPESFAAGRYQVRRFLGEGGRKRVFLAHDALLDRDVAFALIKTDGLDDVGRERIVREAQAMGRMGAHPHIVSVFDLGEEQGAPYIVTELMGGGDVEGEVEKAAGALELRRALEIATGVAHGLALAHERGIVHRDLKPGNVWLTADGVAKIGDFGLAVAAGRSRLTQHGMMVGTFDYMPPEQALGNEATAQSDLYSLGAMLYELVTGKPPFQGDTPTAVISQHLNAQPVAPSWHTEHCPPALEDLILALLAKEPSARPASAADVLTTLERIDPAARSRSHSDSQANPLDALAHGVFVGRERELERLRSSLDSALQGRGSVVMLVGEPGIGKTRTTQELETYARMRGAKVLWGRAHESGGAPPYWPWVQVARAYREETPDAEQRRRQYEPYAVELQRIFPALKELFPNLPAPPADTEEGQFRLFDAFAGFARAVATETPLVFVLDDLHWADRATLQLLTHLARELSRVRILVVGTYRDTDLDRRHPLAQALAELNREDLFTRVPLRGLTLTETADYVRRASNVDLPGDLTTRIYEETEGNPFFLSEVVNLMTQEGTLTAAARDVQIPEGVRQALGRRLDRLSEDANALLTTLAVAGRDLDHALVSALSPHDDATTLALVEEALRARVLEESGVGRYRFTHALMQETLRDELSAARRVLLHGQIAEVCERLYGEARDTLATIAEHYRESAVLNPTHAAKAAHYLRLAAEEAEHGFAWGDVVRHVEALLSVDQGTQSDADLSLLLGRAQAFEGDLRVGEESIAHAFETYRTRGDKGGAARAASELIWALGSRTRQIEVIRTTLAMPAPLDHDTVAQLSAMLAARLSVIGAPDDAALMLDQIGPPMTDESPFARGLRLYAAALIAVSRGELRRASELGAAAADAYTEARHEQFRVHNALLVQEYAWGLLGALDRLDPVTSERLEYAERHRDRRWIPVSWAALRRMDFLRADVAGLATAHGNADDNPWASFQTQLERCELSALAVESLQVPDVPDPSSSEEIRLSIFGLQAWAAVLRGDAAGARAAAERWIEWARSRLRSPRIPNALQSFGTITPVVFDVAMPALEQWFTEWLTHQPECRSTGFASADWLRGGLALRRDAVDEAEQHYRTGLEWCERERCPVEAGKCHFGLADVAERRGDHAQAMGHLDAAGALFARYGAKRFLDQVIAKKEILKA